MTRNKKNKKVDHFQSLVFFQSHSHNQISGVLLSDSHVRCQMSDVRCTTLRSARKGQSLIEIIVAIALAGVLLGGAVAMIVAFTRSNKTIRESQTAIDLGTELTESVRALANSNWQSFYSLKKQSSAGLLGYWKFDDNSGPTAIDSSGAGHDGTLEGGASFVPGKFGKALSLNGVDGHVDLVTPDMFDTINEGTILAWVKPVNPSERFKIWFGAGSGISGCENPFELAVSNPGNFEIYAGTGSCYVAPTVWTLNAIALIPNPTDWHLLAYTSAILGNKLYVDGAQAAATYPYDLASGDRGTSTTQQFFSNTSGGTTKYSIGRAVENALGDDEFFNGLIDEVRVYNRALCPSEMPTVMNNYETPQPYHVTTTQATLPRISAADCEETIVVNGVTYMRWFHVKNVYRDTSGNIVDSSASVAIEDPSTQYVVVRVTWTGNPIGLYFAEYLTRTRRDEVFVQSDWSGGPNQETFPNENANNKFSTSTNIEYSSSSGSLFEANTTMSSGTLISSVFDNQSSSSLNSVLWKGSPGGLSTSVGFQIATSTSSLGPWNYFVPNSDYSTQNNDSSIKITQKDVNNVRYFRYKIFINSPTSGESSPRVDDVIINYSP